MRRLAPIVCLALLGAGPGAADAMEAPRLVRVVADAALAERLVPEFDVVESRAGELRLLLWPGDERRLAALGASAEPIDDDPGRTAASRVRAEREARPAPPGRWVRSATRDDGVFRPTVLPPFGSGSLGGFWNLAEVKTKLDDLVASDANDVVADQVDTLGFTVQGRPIWGLRLGKTVAPPDTRPVVYYNALTHAREPGGMQALLWFVDDLLAGYGVDPVATDLLDHRVLYVVPVVNPDGYRLNEDTWTSSGGTSFGMWRKNLRDNDGDAAITNADGVDLNRNYGYQLGVDNTGSSPTPSSGTYRGESAFSEPETQAQRDAVIARRPATGVSFHTYSDLLLHPWGYTTAAAPDSEAFYEWDDEMSAGTGYQTGQSTRILYRVNGEFNDWCYGETVAKPRAWTWTPEAGSASDGFWPPPSRLVPIARDNLRTCYLAAAIAGPTLRVERFELDTPSLNAGFVAGLTLRARNLGLAGTDAPVTVLLTPVSDGARVLQGGATLPAVAARTSADLPAGEGFQVAADDTVTPGRLLRFRVDFVAPGMFSRDTIDLVCGTPTVLFADGAAGGTAGWTTTAWGVASSDPLHPGPWFTDSPAGNYPSNANRAFTRTAPLDLRAGVHAWAFYEARWSFEADFDAGRIEASLDGTAWTALAGSGTSPGRAVGGGTQTAGSPVYGGTRRRWRAERVDLSAFTGPAASSVRLRFRSTSDAAANDDGLAIDSVRVLLYDPAVQPSPVAVEETVGAPATIALAPPSPNPARGPTRVAFALARAAVARLEVLDLAGRRIRGLADGGLAAGSHVREWDGRDESGNPAPAGVYLVRLAAEGRAVVRRLARLR